VSARDEIREVAERIGYETHLAGVCVEAYRLPDTGREVVVAYTIAGAVFDATAFTNTGEAVERVHHWERDKRRSALGLIERESLKEAP
jgi:hypothetical protein